MVGVGRCRRHFTSVAAFALYLAVTFLLFALPLLAHPGRTYLGSGLDPEIYVWSFAWWPHAVLHGLNPVVSHAVWAPDGVNLAWTTSVPGLAFPFAPLTLVFGPVVAYNVAAVLMPALDAWTAFLLCRYLTRSWWPSLLGGYVFGFSGYLVAQEETNLHLTAVFLLPVAALLVVRFLDGDLGATAFAVGFGGLLAFQCYLSTEILFTLTLALLSTLTIAYVLVPAARSGLRSLPLPLAGAYALAGVICSPFLYFAVRGFQPRALLPPDRFTADALNFLVPTTALGSWWTHGLERSFPGNGSQQDAYLGLPLLTIVAFFLWSRRHTPKGRFLGASFLLAALASFGDWLTADGHRLLMLPWVELARLPLFDNVIPSRLGAYAALSAAVIAATWAAEPHRPAWLPALLGSLAVVSLLPDLGLHAWATSPRVPAFFTTGAYRSCLRQGENVLALPFGTLDDSMLWQTDSSFWFRLAGGYLTQVPPDSFVEPTGVRHVATEDLPPKLTAADIHQFVRLKSVTSIVVELRRSSIYRPLLHQFGPPEIKGDVLIYRPDGEPAASHTACVAN